MENKLLEKEIKRFLDSFPCRKTTNNYKHLLKTFFVQNGKRDLEYPIYYRPSRGGGTRPMCVPNMEEAWKMSNFAGSLKAHAIVSFLWTTGLRNATFRALKYGSVATKELIFQEYTFKKEIKDGKKNLAIIVYPEMKKYIPNACKNRIPYFVFTPEETTEALKNYLDERERKNGTIGDDEFLFPSDYRGFSHDDRTNNPMTSEALVKVVKTAARNAGLKNWKHVTPHCLKKTFNMSLINQLEGSRLDETEREFFMGHILKGVQEPYFVRTGIEEMRKKFSKLKFNPNVPYDGEQFTGKFAKFYGIDYEQVLLEAEKRSGKEPTENEIMAVLKEFIENGKKKKKLIIEESKLSDYMDKGWELENSLPSGKVVICRTGFDAEEEKIDKNVEEEKSSAKSEHSASDMVNRKSLNDICRVSNEEVKSMEKKCTNQNPLDDRNENKIHLKKDKRKIKHPSIFDF